MTKFPEDFVTVAGFFAKAAPAMNESKVVRYECIRCGDKFMNVAVNGTFVTHADYRALEEHRASVEFLLKIEREAHEAKLQELASIKARVVELEAGWKEMTDQARQIQHRHLDNHEGDVYHAMQSLASKFGHRWNAPLTEAINTARKEPK